MPTWDQAERPQVLKAWLGMARPRWGPPYGGGRPPWLGLHGPGVGEPGSWGSRRARCGDPRSRPQGAHPPVALSRPRATETPARPRQARKAVRSSSLDQQRMLVTSLQLRAVLARIGGPGKETPLELGKRRPSLGTRCGNPVINYSETVGRQLRIRI